MQSLLKILLLPFTTIAAAMGWLGRASVATRIAWIVALFQFVVVALAVSVVLGAGDRAVLQSWWSPGKALALVLLLVLVPLLVYQAARLWLEHQGGRWPDIAAAWSAAVDELSRQQISLTDSPLFIVLGSDGGELERALFAEPPTPIVVQQSPPGGGPLHIFALRDAIFVCLSGAGQTALSAASVRVAMADGVQAWSEPLSGASPEAVADHSHSGVDQEADALAGAGQPAVRSPRPLRSAKERREATDRLESACDQLRQARIPWAAINGVVVLLPLQIDREADADAASLGQAVGEDLATITRVLGVRAPVTLVAGVLQDEPAIDELLSRLDAGNRSAACGQPFPPGLPPTPEHLHAVAFNASGLLNDRLAELLLDPRRISKQPANRHLLAMLGRLRLHISTQIDRVLQQAFSPDLHGGVDGRRGVLPLLAGCYVASISGNPSRRAYVRGLLDRVVQMQGELDWTDESLQAEAWAVRMSRVLFAAAGVMIVTLVAIVWWRVSR
ncbi:MAG: hypothetical protein HQ464_15090 [Planctomycetes bacterium]|nr:hypothetical protein [Planctomycetota bacterium]